MIATRAKEAREDNRRCNAGIRFVVGDMGTPRRGTHGLAAPEPRIIIQSRMYVN